MSATEHDHSPQAIADRLASGPRNSYLRDGIYGAIDGAVTTFAVVAGVVGASLESNVILVLGVANLFADGFSMAAGNFAATRTELAEREHFAAMERRHIRETPEGEREEVRQIYRAKGLDGQVLEDVVQALTSSNERWVKTMLVEEHGLPMMRRSPWRAAGATFAAFCVAGVIPLLPWIFGGPRAFLHSAWLTGAVFFAIGSVKGRWSVKPAWRAGVETLLIGGVAAGLAYVLGRALANLGA